MKTVEVQGKRITSKDQLEIGDYVKSRANKFSRVYSFSHIDKNLEASFLHIHMERLQLPLEVTPEHIGYVSGHPVRASNVRVGDFLDGHHMVTRITSYDLTPWCVCYNHLFRWHSSEWFPSIQLRISIGPCISPSAEQCGTCHDGCASHDLYDFCFIVLQTKTNLWCKWFIKLHSANHSSDASVEWTELRASGYGYIGDVSVAFSCVLHRTRLTDPDISHGNNGFSLVCKTWIKNAE
jgi:hypothetical protein